ncbi:MAG TPA: apolipoprotein N-acyltransferase [Methylocella sp.]|nr:apolipoprotein N-acyltransferase [Methylocella sp.]
MLAIAASIILASGWRRRLIALAAGATGALAMAPFNFFPALAIPMTVAVWLIDGCAETRKMLPGRRFGLGLPVAAWRAFGAGWWWGFGYFLAGLWWLGAAFLVEADEFAWALPLGVVGLPAALAIFPGLGFLIARLLWMPGASRLFALAAGLSFAEWLRGHVLTGFPWNTFGMAFGGNLVTAQLASLIGLYGLTVIAILIFSAPAVFGEKSARQGGRLPRAIAAAALAFAGICAFGALRLAATTSEPVAGVKLRIMQPNLAQDAKFRPENKARILSQYLILSARGAGSDSSGLDDVTVLIWPESAFPFILSRDAGALAEIGAVLPQDTVLVTGAARADDEARRSASGRARYFNAIQVIASGGHILDSYDKVHLVPFGEYLPLQTVFDRLGLRQFVHIPGGFEAGSKRQLLVVPGLPAVAPLICYEAIFPGEVVPAGAARPGLLLNVTNDGWFGTSTGPYQHFAQARLRAIEEGLPLIRAANSGISAIVDPYGRVLAELPLGAEGVLDGVLPQTIAPPVFARFPFVSAFSVWIAVFAIAVSRRQGNRMKNLHQANLLPPLPRHY